MADVFTVLRADHEQVKMMLAQLEDGPTARDGASADQLARRSQLVEEVIIEESRHEAAEQQCFWPVVRGLGPDGARVAEQALEQEEDSEKVLSTLSTLNLDDERFETLLAGFITAARSHIIYEEAHAWPLLSVEISQARAEELGAEIIAAKRRAPTRPHPGIPVQGGPRKAATTMAAAADKLRDTVTGRGRP
jgi:hypothetical protein